ncbi:MAG: MBL fold metallo-hydrolase [Verrucomicrobia bacterium]|nr:MBL fold metallo-hydrolase [Verrucomicrobiota bacterium]
MRGIAMVKGEGRGKSDCLSLAFTLLGMILLAGCGGRELQQGTAREVRVDWLGNQAFLITSSIGTSILTNPYASGTSGRTLPSPLKPDIILISNERADANNIDAADNQPTVFRSSMGIGINNANGLGIRGVATFRDPEKESADGMNLVYSWSMDGMRFCFLGSPAGPLSSAQLSQLGTVDVLFVPVAGSLSPSAREAVLSQIRPRLVIPMGRGAGWTYGSVRSVDGHSVLLSRPALPLQTTTLLFGS